jgi:hypothetical protein
MAARVVELHFDRQPVAEDFAPPAERALSSLEIGGEETGCDRPACRTGQHLKSFTSLSYLLPGNPWTSARLLSVSLLPAGELTDARSGDERCEIVESLFAPSQEGGGTSVDVDLSADYWPYALSASFEPEADNSSKVRGVGNPDCAVAKQCRTSRQRFG